MSKLNIRQILFNEANINNNSDISKLFRYYLIKDNNFDSSDIPLEVLAEIVNTLPKVFEEWETKAASYFEYMNDKMFDKTMSFNDVVVSHFKIWLNYELKSLVFEASAKEVTADETIIYLPSKDHLSMLRSNEYVANLMGAMKPEFAIYKLDDKKIEARYLPTKFTDEDTRVAYKTWKSIRDDLSKDADESGKRRPYLYIHYSGQFIICYDQGVAAEAARRFVRMFPVA